MDNKIKDELKRLKNGLVENRSDIAEILDSIISGEKWDNSQIESRFINADLPDGTKVEYDTLTTEISYLSPGKDNWEKAIHHEYIKNSDIKHCLCCGEELNEAEIKANEEKCFPCVKGNCEDCA